MVKLPASEILTDRQWRPPGPLRHLSAMAKRTRFKRTYIKDWRRFRDMTLEELAEHIGMTAGYMSLLENGHRGYTQDTLEAIAAALKVDAPSLLMRPPGTGDALFAMWEEADERTRIQLEEIAKTFRHKE